jgi:hypothetical protein
MDEKMQATPHESQICSSLLGFWFSSIWQYPRSCRITINMQFYTIIHSQQRSMHTDKIFNKFSFMAKPISQFICPHHNRQLSYLFVTWLLLTVTFSNIFTRRQGVVCEVTAGAGSTFLNIDSTIPPIIPCTGMTLIIRSHEQTEMINGVF